MKKRMIVLFIFSVLLGGQLHAQYRSGIFLHHSTGACIWGPNGSNTSVPQQMDSYNSNHGYSGSQAITMNEEWWSPDDNEWVRQHAFFEDPSPVTGIGYYLSNNKIIVVKSCFPSSSMSGPGVPDDTIYPDMKTVYNYKWHWRHIFNVIKSHPANFFVIWTNAPLEPASTNADEAVLANWFCKWAKDTLAAGIDPVYGIPPANVYVFDYFHKVAGQNGMELVQYRTGPGDSHPNAAATALVAPQFVTEIFDAAIAYENVYSIIPANGPPRVMLTVCPNPFGKESVIRITGAINGIAEVNLLDASGNLVKTIWSGYCNGAIDLKLAGEDLAAGIYFLQFRQSGKVQINKLIHF